MSDFLRLPTDSTHKCTVRVAASKVSFIDYFTMREVKFSVSQDFKIIYNDMMPRFIIEISDVRSTVICSMEMLWNGNGNWANQSISETVAPIGEKSAVCKNQ